MKEANTNNNTGVSINNDLSVSTNTMKEILNIKNLSSQNAENSKNEEVFRVSQTKFEGFKNTESLKNHEENSYYTSSTDFAKRITDKKTSAKNVPFVSKIKFDVDAQKNIQSHNIISDLNKHEVYLYIVLLNCF
jgi:hypothetical protein